MALNSVLEQYGLTDKQASVYLATLELGRAPVLRIAEKAGVKRPTTYVLLQELLGHGLVDLVPRGSMRLYQATDPQILVERLKQKTSLLEESMPQLRALLNTAVGKPKVRFYEGKRAIYELYDKEILRQKELFSLVNLREFAAVYNEKEMIALLNRMKHSGVRATELINDSPEGRWYKKEKEDRGLGDTRFIPAPMSFAVDFIEYGDTVVMISLKNLVAVAIEDKAIHAGQSQLLRFVYDRAKA